MEIIVLMAQRKCSYPGQYGLEVLACMSEHEYRDNPDYLADALAASEGSGEFDAAELITLKVPDEEISSRLYPGHDPVQVEVAE